MGLNSAMLGVVIQHKNVKTTDYSTIPEEVNLSLSQQFAPGTGSQQGDLVFGPDRRTLAGGANESLDLAGGGLLDNQGNAFTPAKVRAVVIQNLSLTKILTIGDDANRFVGVPADTLPPMGKFAKDNPITGWPVTPDTGDKIKVANNAGDPADYLVWILGTSA